MHICMCTRLTIHDISPDIQWILELSRNFLCPNDKVIYAPKFPLIGWTFIVQSIARKRWGCYFVRMINTRKSALSLVRSAQRAATGPCVYNSPTRIFHQFRPAALSYHVNTIHCSRHASDSINLRKCVSPISLKSRQFSSAVETKEFQAETRKLLDIVTHSIYTDKEVRIYTLNHINSYIHTGWYNYPFLSLC